MKSVLISIQPKWCELIASGKKTVEVRKSRPKLETPFKVYIYATKSGDRLVLKNDKVFEISRAITGKVIGEFICDEIYDIGYSPYNHGGFISSTDNLHEKSCLDLEQMFNYLSQGYGYGWHISDLVIYDKPRELSRFWRCPYPWDCDVCDYFDGFDMSCNKPKRPPQSWCYVEGGAE